MRLMRTGGVLLVLMVCVFSSGAALAQSGQANQSFTLQPGGTATITFEAFCTDFGLKFPTAIQAPNALAEDKVRSALAYIQTNNLSADPNKALEAQYAIWQLRGATGSPAGGADAQAVVSAAATAPAAVSGTSVVDAAKAGQVSVTVSGWQPIGNKVPIGAATDNFYGRGTVTVQNTSNQALTLSMPVGTLFPPATAGEQTMASYATNVQVTNPQAQSQGQSGQQGQPQQLPTTGDGGQSFAWAMVAAALGLIGAGAAVQLGFKKR